MTRNILSFTLITLLLSLFWSSDAVAKSEQTEKPKHFFGVVSHKVKPDHYLQYIDAIKTRNQIYQEQNLDIPWMSSFMTDDLTFYWSVPISSVAEMQTVMGEFERVRQAYGAEKYDDVLGEAFDDTIGHHGFEVIRLDPDLSYTPKKPRLKHSDQQFFRTFEFNISAKNGARDKIIELAKKIKAINEKHEIPNGYEFYWRFIGSDFADVTIVEFGKDPADYYSAKAKDRQKVGKDMQAHQSTFMSLVSDYSYRQGTLPQSLFYVPKKD